MSLQPSTTSTTGETAASPPRIWRMALRSGRVRWGGSILAIVILPCLISLPWTTDLDSPLAYEGWNDGMYKWPELYPSDKPPPYPPRMSQRALWFGTDEQPRSLLGRCLMGGAISLAVGVGAAALSVFLGVGMGMVAGYRGGWVDALLMRAVDILYGLPYVLLVILLKIALERPLLKLFHPQLASLVVLFLAIGLVSWLTMARVIRGQVLSLRGQPFIEAARAAGLPERRIFLRHLLPNLAGPIIVYATLTIPQAILQESFLSFLGIGIQPPLPTWGSLASEARGELVTGGRWWLLAFPCILLALTLLSLNFLGDGLRDVLDPKREAAKI